MTRTRRFRAVGLVEVLQDANEVGHDVDRHGPFDGCGADRLDVRTPSTSTTRVLRCAGSLASAWSKTAEMTSVASSAMEAVSHVRAAFGPGRFVRFLLFFVCFFFPAEARVTMSCGRLGAGSAS